MIIIIKAHKGGVDLVECSSSMSAAEVVEKWQRSSIHYQLYGTFPPCTWKVAEKSNFVNAMIESARM
jgi:hypothetical protein